MVSVNSSENLISIKLEPNRSATWKQTRVFVICLGTFVLAISIAWSFVGAWLVLPFAGIEVALLAYFMYRVSKNTYKYEQVIIDDSSVTLITSKQQWRWSNSKVKLIVYRAEKTLDVSRVFLTSVGEPSSFGLNDAGVEFGIFLNQTDKKLLLSTLRPHLDFSYRSLHSRSVKA